MEPGTFHVPQDGSGGGQSKWEEYPGLASTRKEEVLHTWIAIEVSGEREGFHSVKFEINTSKKPESNLKRLII